VTLVFSVSLLSFNFVFDRKLFTSFITGGLSVTINIIPVFIAILLVAAMLVYLVWLFGHFVSSKHILLLILLATEHSKLMYISVEKGYGVQKHTGIIESYHMSNTNVLFTKNNRVLQKCNDSEMTKRFRNSRTVLKTIYSLSERHQILQNNHSYSLDVLFII
jgi:hypothetical protein